ncbi:hypothetical protein Tco_1337859 [Tanacetum coccineum]
MRFELIGVITVDFELIVTLKNYKCARGRVTVAWERVNPFENDIPRFTTSEFGTSTSGGAPLHVMDPHMNGLDLAIGEVRMSGVDLDDGDRTFNYEDVLERITKNGMKMNTVMSSDEALSGVTYTFISSDYEEPSNVGVRAGTALAGLRAGPEYPEYLAPSDEEVPVEDQPYAAADSPIALSPGYIADSDLGEDMEDESEDGPTDYPADGGDDDNSSGDDADDVDEEEASKTSIRAHTPIPFPFEADVDRLLAILTLPPSPLTPLSSPLPQIPSQPFPVTSPPTTSPTYTKAPLGYMAVRIRLRTASPLPLPLS